MKAISVNDLASLEKVKEAPLTRREPLSGLLHRSRASWRSSPAASRGIGRAIAVELARAGAQVVVGYRSGAEEAEALAAEIGGRAVQADVGDPEQAARLVEEAGDLDILVNNAGLTRDGLIAAHVRRGLARRCSTRTSAASSTPAGLRRAG